MGNTSSMLTQYDIEEVQQHCNHAFTQQEIVSLYERFCQLDRNNCGFIPSDEFLSIPEFAVNPLSQSLLRMLDGFNFKEFIAFLSAFSPRATLQNKIEFIFKVYDTDCNGKVSFDDILTVLRDLTGQYMSEDQRKEVLAQVLEEAGYTKDSFLVLSDFMKVLKQLISSITCCTGILKFHFGKYVIRQVILGNSDLKMEAEVPVD
ncbi:hypothetical protein KIW84_040301 [Lathyrus oleraceus]|uniref:EF-hand domain-containing protein n=1 Tax=Pisum sativum TaxID=3888 RepID=A0A9D4X6Q5_PEA|nr:hypothetical protein KIW84_040301 [Pisum sativum]